MLAFTHLVVSLLLVHILTLDKNDAFVALTFGVFIDVDHVFGLKDYVSANGFEGLLDFDSLKNPDGQWKSLFHSPVAVMIVGPASSASRLAIPLVFWGMHITMDYAEDTYLGLLSVWEMLLLAGASAALVYLGFRKARLSDSETSLLAYVRRRLSRMTAPVLRLRHRACR